MFPEFTGIPPELVRRQDLPSTDDMRAVDGVIQSPMISGRKT
jgi:hypothetical protein